MEKQVKSAALWINVLRFRQFNLRGRAFGDRVNKALHAVLIHTLRPHPVYCLAGGEFFVLLQDRTDLEELAQRVLDRAGMLADGGYQIPLIVQCVGVWTDVPVPALDLLQSCYTLRSEANPVAIGRAVPNVSDLTQAIARAELVVVYQPVRDLRTLEILGHEALSRWTHPDYGPVSPARFIPLAQQNGLGMTLLEYVATSAASFQRRSGGYVSINVAPDDVLDPGFEEWCRVLDPAIVLELTERSFNQVTWAEIRPAIARTHAQGRRWLLDDFGTGVNSLIPLRYAQHFWGLKIDQQFVSGTDAYLPLCDLVGAMAHALGLRVIAEGVETTPQLRALLEYGIEAGQGFHPQLGRPKPPEEWSQESLHS